MTLHKKQLFAAVGSLSMAALLATSSFAQAPEGDTPKPEQNTPRRERAEGDQPRGDRPEGARRGDRPQGGPGREGMRPDPKAMVQMMLTRFDKDGDMKLDSEELVTAMTEMRSQMGQGGGPGGFGGGPGGPGGPQMAARMLEQNDANKDGKLTGEEIPERMRQGMARIDTNSDGAIDREELEKMMSNFSAGRGPREGAPGEGDRRPRRPASEE